LNANRKIIRTAFFTAVFVLGMPGPVRADVVFIGGVDMGGTGFGNVNTIMTMQALGQQMGSIESGCVGVSDQGRLSTTVQWLNTHNQTDSDLCQGGNIGGFEKPPSDFPHNQTFKISDAAKLVVVFNSDQPAGGSVSLKKPGFRPLQRQRTSWFHIRRHFSGFLQHQIRTRYRELRVGIYAECHTEGCRPGCHQRRL
jgi:hypothetical protein